MLKKIFEKILKYRELEKELTKTKEELRKYYLLNEHAKTRARKIVRAINKCDDILAKKLCNEIIKGEEL